MMDFVIANDFDEQAWMQYVNEEPQPQTTAISDMEESHIVASFEKYLSSTVLFFKDVPYQQHPIITVRTMFQELEAYEPTSEEEIRLKPIAISTCELLKNIITFKVK